VSPVNAYGRSKVEGERLVEAARRDGVRASILRLSNVFGSIDDHADRVVPAFVRAAIEGKPLRVDGADHVFDFTHLDDVARGFVALARALEQTVPPPIQLVSGVPTSLHTLATLVIALADSSSTIHVATPRAFDVARYVGDPARARDLLGWAPRVSLRDGLARLIRAFREPRDAHHSNGAAP